MAAIEQRFLLGLSFEDVNRAGLVMESDGTIWIVAADGTRTQLTGGGGGGGGGFTGWTEAGNPADVNSNGGDLTADAVVAASVGADTASFGDTGLVEVAEDGTFTHDGPALGLFGHAPSAQPSHPTTMNELVTGLVSLGVVAA